MFFPLAFSDDLRAQVPLAALVGRRVKLTQSGTNWKGRRPFHNEEVSSFYVYTSSFHCFGCEAFGDVIAYLMETESIFFPRLSENLPPKPV